VAGLVGVGGALLARGEAPRIDTWRGVLGPALGQVAPPDGAREAVADLIGRLDAAVRSGDQAAIAALTAPDAASGAVAPRQRWQGLAARAAAVGATGLRLTLPPGPLPQPAASATVVSVPAGFEETLMVPVRLAYTLPGWDDAPVSTVISVPVGRTGTTWRLIEEGDSLPAEAATPVEPWVNRAVSVVRTPHVMVVGDPTRRTDNQRLAQALEKAVASVRAAVPTQRWNGRVVAYAATDERIVASWFGSRAAGEGGRASSDPAAFAAEVRTLSGQPGVAAHGWTGTPPAATAGASARPSASGASSGPAGAVAGGVAPGPVAARMAVTPFLLRRTDARAQAVLRHEVTHVALALEGQGTVPTWLVEGTAEYTAYRAVESGTVRGLIALDRRGLPAASWEQLRSPGWRPTLVADGQRFYAGTNAQVARAYTDAWLTCLFIAAHYGETSLYSLYGAAAAQPSGQGVAVTEAAALRQVLRIDREALRRAASSYARGVRSRFT